MKSFSKSDVLVLEKKELYSGFFKMLQYKLKHKLFQGGWSAEITREIFERGDAAGVIPYDPIRDQVVLIEQFRVGALNNDSSPWLFECVAGMLDGQEPEEVCRKEAKEEAGLDIGRMTKALSYLSSPGGMSERIHIYIGEVDASKAQGVHGLDSEDEDIKVHTVPFEKAAQMVEQGQMDNAATLIGIQWLMLNKDKLRANWLNP